MVGIEGVVCVLKPPGMSSSDAVTDIRRVFNEKRVGHTGTLDPAAAGVLPVCLGRAARLFDFLVDKQKEYIAEIVFGAATDTEDATGKVIETSERRISKEELADVLSGFTGRIDQTPPIYSALNLNGVKLYKLARSGEVKDALESKKRSVDIFELELIGETGENRFLIRIVCSKGTYIRTLCRDIGVRIGCPAYMGFLLRTRSGSFTLDKAYSIAELAEMKENGTLSSAVVPMDRAIEHVPELRISDISRKNEQLLIHGAPIAYPGPEGKPMRIYLHDEFMGIGEIRDSMLRITVWLGDEAYQIKGMKISGTVIEHNHIGRKLGFPTANITGFKKQELPSEGVYATASELDGTVYPSVTSIGFNPTFGGKELTVETHIIGFDGDCRGKQLTVRFIKKLRGMIRFDSAKELSDRIALDAEEAKKLFADSKYTE